MQWINSSDSHVLEPADLYPKALGEKYADECPRYVDSYQGVSGKFYFTGYEYIRLDNIGGGDDPERASFREDRIRASEDPHERIKCLDKDGVWGEVLNATWTLYTLRSPNDDLARDCCQVFNDWLTEHCSAEPRRLYGTGMVHLADVDWAVKELERAAKKGVRSILINSDARPGWPQYHDPIYDRFWAAAQDHDLSITIHIIAGNVKDLFTFHGAERGRIPGETLKLFSEASWVLSNDFIFGGIFDRFPRLKVVCSEYEVSWLPHWLYRNRQLCDKLGQAANVVPPKRPVDAYQDQIFHCLIDDTAWEVCIGHANLKNIAWGSDFPHARCTYPRSQQVVEALFGSHDPGLVADLSYYNIANFFNMTLPEAREIAGA